MTLEMVGDGRKLGERIWRRYPRRHDEDATGATLDGHAGKLAESLVADEAHSGMGFPVLA
jgi:hypothetical protein